MKKCLLLLVAAWMFTTVGSQAQTERAVWSKEKAAEWLTKQGWLRGANFIPSTAINQLEMWQKETFDPATIDKELGFAENIGMNAMRVFLHHVAWQTDPVGFKNRINQYLAIADKHHVKTMFVFLMIAGTRTMLQASSVPPSRAYITPAGYATRENYCMKIPLLQAILRSMSKIFSPHSKMITGFFFGTYIMNPVTAATAAKACFCYQRHLNGAGK